MVKEYVCLNCNQSYKSRKQNSKFCSLECRRKYNNIPYNCDYCGQEMLVYRNQIEKLESGYKKHLYCSKECANNGQITSVKNVCENCGETYKIFNVFKDVQKYCSKDCFNEYRIKNSITHKSAICPICKEPFITDRKDQIYCSKQCRDISEQDRLNCTCDYCGVSFDRKRSEVEKNKRHYCSDDCRMKGMFWSKQDSQLLIDNYGKMSYKEMVDIFSEHKTVDQISRRAIFLGLTSPRDWTDEEIQIIKNNYSIVSMDKMKELLPSRTEPSILHKARELNLKSLHFLSSRYTEEEDQFLQDNYLEKSDDELAKLMRRSKKGISLHLYFLGLHRPKEILYQGYQDLCRYVRARITPWKNNIRKENGYICEITGNRSNIIVHHIRSFNLIFEEVVDILNFPIYESMELYTLAELNNFVDLFLYLQDEYNSYICICEDVHKHFHNEYGYGNNTQEQWDEFVNKYYNNVA